MRSAGRAAHRTGVLALLACLVVHVGAGTQWYESCVAANGLPSTLVDNATTPFNTGGAFEHGDEAAAFNGSVHVKCLQRCLSNAYTLFVISPDGLCQCLQRGAAAALSSLGRSSCPARCSGLPCGGNESLSLYTTGPLAMDVLSLNWKDPVVALEPTKFTVYITSANGDSFGVTNMSAVDGASNRAVVPVICELIRDGHDIMADAGKDEGASVGCSFTLTFATEAVNNLTVALRTPWETVVKAFVVQSYLPRPINLEVMLSSVLNAAGQAGAARPTCLHRNESALVRNSEVVKLYTNTTAQLEASVYVGRLLSFSWYFSDDNSTAVGSPDASCSGRECLVMRQDHTFRQVGIHTITVTVSNLLGSLMHALTVVVLDHSIQNFDVTLSSKNATVPGSIVSFTVHIQTAAFDEAMLAVDFGDNTTSTFAIAKARHASAAVSSLVASGSGDAILINGSYGDICILTVEVWHTYRSVGDYVPSFMAFNNVSGSVTRVLRTSSVTVRNLPSNLGLVIWPEAVTYGTGDTVELEAFADDDSPCGLGTTWTVKTACGTPNVTVKAAAASGRLAGIRLPDIAASYSVEVECHSIVGSISAGVVIMVEQRLGDIVVTRGLGSGTYLASVAETIEVSAVLSAGSGFSFAWIAEPVHRQTMAGGVIGSPVNIEQYTVGQAVSGYLTFLLEGTYEVSLRARNGLGNVSVPVGTIRIEEQILRLTVSGCRAVLVGNTCSFSVDVVRRSKPLPTLAGDALSLAVVNYRLFVDGRSFAMDSYDVRQKLLFNYTFTMPGSFELNASASNDVSRASATTTVVVMAGIGSVNIAVAATASGCGGWTLVALVNGTEDGGVGQELLYEWYTTPLDSLDTVGTGSEPLTPVLSARPAVCLNWTAGGYRVLLSVSNQVDRVTAGADISEFHSDGSPLVHLHGSTAEAGKPFSINLRQRQERSQCPGTWVAALDYGDGSAVAGNLVAGSVIDHVYSNVGLHQLALNVTCFGRESDNSTGLLPDAVPQQFRQVSYVSVEGANMSGLVLSGPTVVPLGLGGAEAMWTAHVNASSNTIYTWNFSDTAEVQQIGSKVVHSFASSGTYMVTVTANCGRDQVTASRIVVIAYPIVEATAKMPSVPVGWTSNLTVEYSGCDGGFGELLMVDFGDGSKPVTLSAGSAAFASVARSRVSLPQCRITVSHTYNDTGVYLATVNVSNAVSTMQIYVVTSVDELISGVSMAASSYVAAVGDVVSFKARASSGQQLSFIWNFSVGNSSAYVGVEILPREDYEQLSIARFRYDMPGTYNVTVFVNNDAYQGQFVTASLGTPVRVLRQVQHLTLRVQAPAIPLVSGSSLAVFTVEAAPATSSLTLLLSYDDGSAEEKLTVLCSATETKCVANVSHYYRTVGAYRPSVTAVSQIGRSRDVRAFLGGANNRNSSQVLYVQVPVCCLKWLDLRPDNEPYNQVTRFYTTMSAPVNLSLAAVGTDILLDWTYGDGAYDYGVRNTSVLKWYSGFNDYRPPIDTTSTNGPWYNVMVKVYNKVNFVQISNVRVYIVTNFTRVELTINGLNLSTSAVNVFDYTTPFVFAPVISPRGMVYQTCQYTCNECFKLAAGGSRTLITTAEFQVQRWNATGACYSATISVRCFFKGFGITGLSSEDYRISLRTKLALLGIDTRQKTTFLVNETVTLSISLASGLDGALFSWMFEGTWSTPSADKDASHVYTSEGEHKVTVIANNTISWMSAETTLLLLARPCAITELAIFSQMAAQGGYTNAPLNFTLSDYVQFEAMLATACSYTNVTDLYWHVIDQADMTEVLLNRTLPDAWLRELTFVLPPGTLPYGSYLAQLEAQVQGTIVRRKVSTPFMVIPSDLVPIIDGGIARTMSVGRNATLDASRSYDPDCYADCPPLGFIWTCTFLQQKVVPCFGSSPTFANSSVVVIDTSQLATKLTGASSVFEFTVYVYRNRTRQLLYATNQAWDFSDKGMLDVSIDCPLCQAYTANSTLDTSSTVRLRVSCTSCQLSTVKYSWTVWKIRRDTLSDKQDFDVCMPKVVPKDSWDDEPSAVTYATSGALAASSAAQLTVVRSVTLSAGEKQASSSSPALPTSSAAALTSSTTLLIRDTSLATAGSPLLTAGISSTPGEVQGVTATLSPTQLLAAVTSTQGAESYTRTSTEKLASQPASLPTTHFVTSTSPSQAAVTSASASEAEPQSASSTLASPPAGSASTSRPAATNPSSTMPFLSPLTGMSTTASATMSMPTEEQLTTIGVIATGTASTVTTVALTSSFTSVIRSSSTSALLGEMNVAAQQSTSASMAMSSATSKTVLLATPAAPSTTKRPTVPAVVEIIWRHKRQATEYLGEGGAIGRGGGGGGGSQGVPTTPASGNSVCLIGTYPDCARNDASPVYNMGVYEMSRDKVTLNRTVSAAGDELVIWPGAMKDGNMYLISATADLGSGLTGTGFYYLRVSSSPKGGTCVLQMTSSTRLVRIVEMQTAFTMSCYGWRDESMPFSYEARFSMNPDNGAQYVIYRGFQSSVTMYLPGGLPQYNYTLFLRLSVYNARGAETPVCLYKLKVNPRILNQDDLYREIVNKSTVMSSAANTRDEQLLRVIALYFAQKLYYFTGQCRSDSARLTSCDTGTQVAIRSYLMDLATKEPVRNMLEVRQTLAILRWTLASEVNSEIDALRLWAAAHLLRRAALTLLESSRYKDIVPPATFDDALVCTSSILEQLSSHNDTPSGDTQKSAVVDELLYAIDVLMTVQQLHKFTIGSPWSYSSSRLRIWTQRRTPASASTIDGCSFFNVSLVDPFDGATPSFLDGRVRRSVSAGAAAEPYCTEVRVVALNSKYSKAPGAAPVVTVTNWECYDSTAIPRPFAKLPTFQGAFNSFIVDLQNRIPLLPRNYTLSKADMNVYSFVITTDDAMQDLMIQIDLEVSADYRFPVVLYQSHDLPPDPRAPSAAATRRILMQGVTLLRWVAGELPVGKHYIALADASLAAGRPVDIEVTRQSYSLLAWRSVCLSRVDGAGITGAASTGGSSSALPVRGLEDRDGSLANSGSDWNTSSCITIPSANLGVVRCVCNGSAVTVTANVTSLDLELTVLPLASFFPNMWKPYVAIVVAIVLCVYVVFLVICCTVDRKRPPQEKIIPLHDNAAADKQKYIATIETGNLPSAGTTAKVSIVLHGKHGLSQTRELIGDSDIVSCGMEESTPMFRRNSRKTFLLTLPQGIGQLWKVQVWHDNAGSSPNWYLKRITIRDVNAAESYFVICEKWFAVEEDDGKVEREFMLSLARDQKLSFLRVLQVKIPQYMADYHMWTSLLHLPTYSRYGRAERFAVFGLAVGEYMALSAIYHYLYVVEYRGEVKLFDLASDALLLGFVLPFVAYVSVLVVSLLFRKSWPLTVLIRELALLRRSTKKQHKVEPLSGSSGVGKELYEVADDVLEHSIQKWQSLQEWAQKQWEKRYQYSYPLPTDADKVESEHLDGEQPAPPPLIVYAIKAAPDSGGASPPPPYTSRISSNSWNSASNAERDHSSSLAAGRCTVREVDTPGCLGGRQHRGATILPWWCRAVAWLVCVGGFVACMCITVYLARPFQGRRIVMWAQSVVVAALTCAFIAQPLFVLLSALYTAFSVVLGRVPSSALLRFTDRYVEDIEQLPLAAALKLSSCSCRACCVEKLGCEDETQRGVAARHRSRLLRLARPPQEKQLIEARKQRMKEKKLWLLVNDAVRFAATFALLCVLAFTVDANSSFLLNNNVLASLRTSSRTRAFLYNASGLPPAWQLCCSAASSPLHAAWKPCACTDGSADNTSSACSANSSAAVCSQLPFSSIKSVGQFWRWTQSELLAALYDLTLSGFGSSIVVGNSIRLRQVRMRPEPCATLSLSSVGICYPALSAAAVSTEPFTAGNSTYVYEAASGRAGGGALWLYGSQWSYSDEGHSTLLPGRDVEAVRSALAGLEAVSWLDAATRAVFVELNLYNPPTAQFTPVTLMLEVEPTGLVLPTAHVQSLRLSKYPAKGSWFWLLCELLFLAMLLAHARHTFAGAWTQRARYFLNPWNVTDVVFFLASLAYAVVTVQRVVIVQAVMDLYGRTFHRKFVSMVPIAVCDQAASFLIGAMLFVLLCRFLCLLRYVEAFARLGNVFRRSRADLSAIVIAYVIAVLAFTSLGVGTLSGTNSHFSDYTRGFTTVASVASHNAHESGLWSSWGMSAFTICTTIFCHFLLRCLAVAIPFHHYRSYRRNKILAMTFKEGLEFVWKKLLSTLRPIKTVAQPVGAECAADQSKTLPPEFALAEMECQVDELLSKMTALSPSPDQSGNTAVDWWGTSVASSSSSSGDAETISGSRSPQSSRGQQCIGQPMCSSDAIEDCHSGDAAVSTCRTLTTADEQLRTQLEEAVWLGCGSSIEPHCLMYDQQPIYNIPIYGEDDPGDAIGVVAQVESGGGDRGTGGWDDDDGGSFISIPDESHDSRGTCRPLPNLQTQKRHSRKKAGRAVASADDWYRTEDRRGMKASAAGSLRRAPLDSKQRDKKKLNGPVKKRRSVREHGSVELAEVSRATVARGNDSCARAPPPLMTECQVYVNEAYVTTELDQHEEKITAHCRPSSGSTSGSSEKPRPVTSSGRPQEEGCQNEAFVLDGNL